MRIATILLLTLAAAAVSAQTTPEVELKLPDGFQATVVARNLGNARHVVVRENGDIYVSLQRGKGGAVALRDQNQDGVADEITYFGEGHGTALAIHNGYLYRQAGHEIVRVKLPEDGSLVPTGKSEVVVAGFVPQTEHAAQGITFDGEGRLYVTVGAPSNACQQENRVAGSKGIQPCTQLQRHAGVWRFRNGEPGHVQEEGEHVATGLRHPFAINYNPKAEGVWLVTHGRDQLRSNWEAMFTEEQNAELPAEEMHKLVDGLDAGWPYTYWDGIKGVRRIAPEYGGNGRLTAREGIYAEPVVAFPAHWAPNDLVFYTGEQFPQKYRGGAFVAFHGSWNRAPAPQQGYCVAFVPMDATGKVNGKWSVFADNFDGSGDEPLRSPSDARHRPCGVATGPDGSLYVVDSRQGYLFKITYVGK